MNLTGKVETVEIDAIAIRALQSKFKTKDVEDELCKMHLWLLRNPKGRPVRMWVFVDKWLNKAPAVKRPPPVVDAWWTTEQRTINQGRALGLEPRPGESMPAFKDRVANKLRAA